MIAKFNPTGTHVHQGKLKIRIDIYPSASDKVYARHYVDKPVREYTETELEDKDLRVLVPTKKELNPCLCHFIQVDENITKQTLAGYIRSILTKNILSELDDALDKGNTNRVHQLMRGRIGSGKSVQKLSTQKLIGLNSRLDSLGVGV